MNASLVYFDIDNTLIDTGKLMENCKLSLLRVGIPPALFESVSTEYSATLESRTDFNPDHFLNYLLKRVEGYDSQALLNAFWRKENFSEALYPESRQVLSDLSFNTRVGIFSQGVQLWQEKKLELSGVSTFFLPENQIIARRKLTHEATIKLKSGSIVVDDKQEVVEYLRSNVPEITVLHINRTRDAISTNNTIFSLADIPIEPLAI